MVANALATLLPGLTTTEMMTRIINDIRNGAGSSGGGGGQGWSLGEEFAVTCSWNNFRDIFYKQYFPFSEQHRYEREYGAIYQFDRESFGEYMHRFLSLASFVGPVAGDAHRQARHFKWGLNKWVLDWIVNTDYTDVALVADAARNIELLHEQKSHNDRRLAIRSGYDLHHNHNNNDQKPWTDEDQTQQLNRRSRPLNQEQRQDQTREPSCVTCGKLHTGRPCYKTFGACYKCGSTEHRVRDCPGRMRNGGEDRPAQTRDQTRH
ncbi:zinc finger, CCHC-type, Retrotransposon gag domain protein [Artemisia annua]|uniref:Zinc finger, CCHC-type, Retrotransposon gag domain protein n=1 Tax=Artemisia annua TaxID=35608 RepID=A0A2U1NET9_ARTAN|nr:zinc finger, CCHC-type, Retrotransposon gag domain protein [Artemisia annua]